MIETILVFIIGFLTAMVVFTIYCQYDARIEVAELKTAKQYLRASSGWKQEMDEQKREFELKKNELNKSLFELRQEYNVLKGENKGLKKQNKNLETQLNEIKKEIQEYMDGGL